MSRESQNFLQRALQAYTDYNPFGVNERAEALAGEMKQDREVYTEDQYLDRVDPTNRQRGVKPTIAEQLMLGLRRSDFDDAGGRINIRNLRKTDEGKDAERLGVEIRPNSTQDRLGRRVERKKNENIYGARSTKDPSIKIEDLTDEELDEQLRISRNAQIENEKYGVLGSDGKRTGASVAGDLELRQADEALATSRSARNVNEGTLGLNQAIARNNQTQQEYQNSRGAYEYEDLKAQAEVERLFQAAQADAKFAADLETLKLQNAAEMDRYNLMIQNDREVRRGDTISDLIQSLVLFGGAMDIA